MFTKQELDLLFEAVEKWEQGDPARDMMSRITASMMMPDGHPGRRAVEEKLTEMERASAVETKRRKERGVMLRAKLIQLRDGLDADDLLRTAAKVSQ